MFSSTLILNSHASPVSLLPLSTASWQDAVRYLYTDVAEALHFYDDWYVHSPSITMQVPSVCMLKEPIPFLKPFTKISRNPQSHLVFLRDGYKCMYCKERFQERELTIDHVVPRTRGGKTTWDNVTTACGPCNAMKGHRTRLRPAAPPFQPSYGFLTRQLKSFPLFVPHLSWNLYLGWDEKLVNFVGKSACSEKNIMT